MVLKVLSNGPRPNGNGSYPSEEELPDLFNNSNVTYIEENVIYTATDEYDDAWGVAHIGADLQHANGDKGIGVKIAGIDSGID